MSNDIWEVKRCKNCGQLYTYSHLENSDGHSRREVIKSIKRNGKYITDHSAVVSIGGENRDYLIYDFPFLKSERISRDNWEYTINDVTTYENVMSHLEEDKIAFADANKNYNEIACPICGSRVTYEKYSAGRNPKGEEYTYSHLLYPTASGFDEEIKQSTYKLHYLEDDAAVTPEFNKILMDCKNSTSLAAPSNVTPKSIDIKWFLKELLVIKTNEYALEQRLRELLHQKLSAEQNYNNVRCSLQNSGITNLEEKMASVNRSIDKIIDKRVFRSPRIGILFVKLTNHLSL